MPPNEDKPLPGTTIDPTCPDSDGMPMGETDFHINAIITLRLALEDFFADQANVYIASNMLLYFEVNGVRDRRDPDLMVVKGVGKHFRRSFRTWEEKAVPCAIFEVASEKTWEVDVYDKRHDYQRIKVPEYFLFDPETRFLNPPLQGFRLTKGKYTPIRRASDGSLTSKELGLRLLPDGNVLRLFNATTGAAILTPRERAEEEHLRAEEERQRAEGLEAENERLRKLLEERKRS